MGDGAPGLEVDDGQVGVIALGQPALVGQAEQAVRAMAGQVDQPLQGQPTLGDMGQHDRKQRLHARHPRGRGGIGPGLLLTRVRRVVGAQHVDDAVGEAMPERRAVLGAADRRVHLGVALQPLVGLRPGQGQVLGRELDAGDVLVGGQDVDLGGGGDVQHVDPLAERAGDPDQAVGR